MQSSILCWTVSGAFFIPSVIAGYFKNKAISSISTTPNQKGSKIMEKSNNKAIIITTVAEAVQNACNTASSIAASTGVSLLS